MAGFFIYEDKEMQEVDHDKTLELFFEFILKRKTAELTTNKDNEYEQDNVSDS